MVLEIELRHEYIAHSDIIRVFMKDSQSIIGQVMDINVLIADNQYNRTILIIDYQNIQNHLQTVFA